MEPIAVRCRYPLSYKMRGVIGVSPAIGMVTAMTTPEGVTPGNLLADDEPAACEYPQIIRVRTAAMRALPKRTLFAVLAKPATGDEDS